MGKKSKRRSDWDGIMGRLVYLSYCECFPNKRVIFILGSHGLLNYSYRKYPLNLTNLIPIVHMPTRSQGSFLLTEYMSQYEAFSYEVSD